MSRTHLLIPIALLAACGAEPAPRIQDPPAPLPAPAPTAWVPIEGVPILRTPAEQFSLLQRIGDPASATATWTVATTEQNAQATLTGGGAGPTPGSAAWRWDLTWTGGKKLEYGELVCDQPLPAGAAAVGFTLHQSAQSVRPALRARLIDSSGEVHQYTATVRPPAAVAGWFPVVIDLAKADCVFAGDGNQRIDPPVRLHSLLADRPGGGFSGSLTLGLGDIAFLAAVPAPQDAQLTLSVANPPVGHLYTTGGEAQLRASIPAGTLAWTVSDLAGRTIATGTGNAPLASISIPLTKPGWYDCTITATAGPARSVRAYRCAALPPGPAPRNLSLGVCTHFPRLDNWPGEALGLVPRLGLWSIRDEISWGQSERTAGEFAIPPKLAWFLPEAKRLGLETLLILCYAHKDFAGTWPTTPEARTAFAAWAGRFVAATPTVSAYEVWNEWSAGTGIPQAKRTPATNTPEAYAELLKATTPLLRSARPDATIIGIGGEHSSWHREAWTKMMAADAGPAMDAASFHPYRWQSDPESTRLADEVTDAAAQVASLGGSGRLWITEVGWTSTPTGPDGSDVRSHGQHLVRALALLASVPAVERTFIYDLMDDGRDPLEKEHHFGLLHHRSLGLMPKPAAVAVAAFSRMTAGATCLGRVNRGDAWAVRFRTATGDELAVAWSAGAPARLGVVISGTPTASFDAAGAALDRTPDELGPWPIYVRGADLAATP